MTRTLPGSDASHCSTSVDGSSQLTFREPAVGHEALYFQAAEVARCIDAGRRESSVPPLAESIATLEVLDEIRRQIGVVFDEES